MTLALLGADGFCTACIGTQTAIGTDVGTGMVAMALICAGRLLTRIIQTQATAFAGVFTAVAGTAKAAKKNTNSQ